MNRTRRFRLIRRIAGVLAGSAATLLASTAVAQAALALPVPRGRRCDRATGRFPVLEAGRAGGRVRGEGDHDHDC
jgi:hypothetical protein